LFQKKEVGMLLTHEGSIYQSAELTSIQVREDAPFGMLFLGVPVASLPFLLDGRVTTQTNDETSNDGTSKLDPVYDEDEDDDEEIPEKY
jgi:hypothetical protein